MMRGWLQAAWVGVGLTCFAGGVTMPAAWAQAGDDAAGMTDEEHQRLLMARYEQMVQYNLTGDHAVPADEIDARMAEFSRLDLGDRIAAWADYFRSRGDARYRYGRDPGGYVSAGRLVDDFATDCLLFFYRTTELGRSTSALEAVQFAYGTRFHAGSLEEIVDDQGRVDYDNPVQLDYSLDILRSGMWGREITAELGPTRPDQAGTSRYPAGTVQYVATADLDTGKLKSGDILFFVSNEEVPAGLAIRESGAMIGHIGIARIEEGDVYLIHPAAKPLPGLYEGGGVVKVLLWTYLNRVETFKGVLVTRIETF